MPDDEAEGSPAMTRASLGDVAALAGVSTATVSRSLRGLPTVSVETRERVLDAARRLSYVPSPLASGLASGRTRTVGVVVPFVTRWYFASVVAGVTEVLRAAGLDVLLYHLGGADDRDRFFDRMPLAKRVDGVLSLSMPLTQDHTLSLRALGIPVVSVGSRLDGLDSVYVDEAAVAAAAVAHLTHLGHTRIGFIGGVPDDPGFGFDSSRLRLEGFRAAVLPGSSSTVAGKEPAPGPMEALAPYGIEGGAEAMSRLLTGPTLPTAVFAEYDELAIGAMWALRRAGLTVPGDLSVIGVDDHEMSTVLDLTTLRQDAVGQGAAGARLLLQRLVGTALDEEQAPVAVEVPTRLVLRGSTAPPRPAS